MNIKFYSCSDPTNTITKTLTDETDWFTCSIKGSVEMLHPVVELGYSSTVVNRNYAYIDVFARYYYVSDLSVDTGSRMVVTLVCDPLMSHKSEILASTGTAIRWAKNTTDYPDEKYPLTDNIFIESKIFNDVLDTNVGKSNYVLNINNANKAKPTTPTTDPN